MSEEIKLENITTVTLPIPQPFSRNFGVRSTKHHEATRETVRFGPGETDLIEQIAASIGVTKSMFIRESALNMAKAIKLHQEKHNAKAKHDLRSG